MINTYLWMEWVLVILILSAGILFFGEKHPDKKAILISNTSDRETYSPILVRIGSPAPEGIQQSFSPAFQSRGIPFAHGPISIPPKNGREYDYLY